MALSLFIKYATAQSYQYSDHKIRFDPRKEESMVMKGSDGFFHVWRWGMVNTTMDVYDADLKHLSSETLFDRTGAVLFFPMKDYYYVLLLSRNKVKFFCVTAGGSCNDQSAILSKIQLYEPRFVPRIQAAAHKLYFIQYRDTDSPARSRVYITAIDSTHHEPTTFELELNYSKAMLGDTRYFALDDQLIFVNRTMNETGTKLATHLVNPATGSVKSNTFTFPMRVFMPEQLIRYGEHFMLQGRANGPLDTIRLQTDYNYLLRLDSNLQEHGKRFYAGFSDSGVHIRNTVSSYSPLPAMILPNKNILMSDYKKNINVKAKKADFQLRFKQLDSSFEVIEDNYQSISILNYPPTFQVLKNNRLLIYYEEQVRQDIYTIHSYQLPNVKESDRMLQLDPRGRYRLDNAISVNNDYFVMPYTRNYRLGLVKVKIIDKL